MMDQRHTHTVQRGQSHSAVTICCHVGMWHSVARVSGKTRNADFQWNFPVLKCSTNSDFKKDTVKTTQHIHAGWVWTMGCHILTSAVAYERYAFELQWGLLKAHQQIMGKCASCLVGVKLCGLREGCFHSSSSQHIGSLSLGNGGQTSVRRVVTCGSGSQNFSVSSGGSSTELQLQETTLNKRNSIHSSFLGI